MFLMLLALAWQKMTSRKLADRRKMTSGVRFSLLKVIDEVLFSTRVYPYSWDARAKNVFEGMFGLWNTLRIHQISNQDYLVSVV